MTHSTDVVGYVAPSGDTYCPDCTGGSYSQEDGPGWTAIFPGTEADWPMHCEQCAELINHALTTDGQQYVRDALRSRDGDVLVLADWSEQWPELNAWPVS